MSPFTLVQLHVPCLDRVDNVFQLAHVAHETILVVTQDVSDRPRAHVGQQAIELGPRSPLVDVGTGVVVLVKSRDARPVERAGQRNDVLPLTSHAQLVAPLVKGESCVSDGHAADRKRPASPLSLSGLDPLAALLPQAGLRASPANSSRATMWNTTVSHRKDWAFATAAWQLMAHSAGRVWPGTARQGRRWRQRALRAVPDSSPGR